MEFDAESRKFAHKSCIKKEQDKKEKGILNLSGKK
jgi:hypothetical protein